MKGDLHVRFCGSAGGKFPCATRYPLHRRRLPVSLRGGRYALGFAAVSRHVDDS